MQTMVATHAGQPAQMTSGGVIPLVMLGTGCAAEIVKIRGGHETRHHLEHMGFVEGGRVTVVCQAGGNLIVEVKGARVALGSQAAAKLMVAPL